VAREIGSPQIVAKARLSLCHLSAESPKMVGAEQCVQAAETFEKLGVPRLRAKALAAHARRQQAVGEMKDARKSYVDAVEVLREQVHASLHGDVLASHLTNLCQVERQLKVEGAFYRCRKALEAIDKVDGERPAMRAAAHHAAGVAAGREGKPEPGIEHLSKAIELYDSDKLEEPASLADARLNHGALLAETGKQKAAEKEFAAALQDIGDAEEYRSARIQIRIQYAQTLLAQKKWKAGAEQLETLADAARQADDDDTRSWALTGLARARVNLDDEDAAKTALQKALPLAKKAGAEGRVKRIEENLKQFD
jgi:hypothetical protein